MGHSLRSESTLRDKSWKWRNNELHLATCICIKIAILYYAWLVTPDPGSTAQTLYPQQPQPPTLHPNPVWSSVVSCHRVMEVRVISQVRNFETKLESFSLNDELSLSPCTKISAQVQVSKYEVESESLIVWNYVGQHWPTPTACGSGPVCAFMRLTCCYRVCVFTLNITNFVMSYDPVWNRCLENAQFFSHVTSGIDVPRVINYS